MRWLLIALLMIMSLPLWAQSGSGVSFDDTPAMTAPDPTPLHQANRPEQPGSSKPAVKTQEVPGSKYYYSYQFTDVILADANKYASRICSEQSGCGDQYNDFKAGELLKNIRYCKDHGRWEVRECTNRIKSLEYFVKTPITCLQGEKGERGEKGEKGERGERGEKGERGEQGVPGAVLYVAPQAASVVYAPVTSAQRSEFRPGIVSVGLNPFQPRINVSASSCSTSGVWDSGNSAVVVNTPVSVATANGGGN